MKHLFDKQNKYSIRKFSIGVCSAVIGLSILNAGTAYAEGPEGATGTEAVFSRDTGETLPEAEDQTGAAESQPETGAEEANPAVRTRSTEPTIMASGAVTGAAAGGEWTVDADDIPTPEKVVTEETARVTSAVGSTVDSTNRGTRNIEEGVLTLSTDSNTSTYWASDWGESLTTAAMTLTLSAESEIRAIQYQPQSNRHGRIETGYIEYENAEGAWNRVTVTSVTGATGVTTQDDKSFVIPNNIEFPTVLTFNIDPVKATKLRLKGIQTFSGAGPDKMLSAGLFIPVDPKVVRTGENVLEDTTPDVGVATETVDTPKSGTEAVPVANITATNSRDAFPATNAIDSQTGTVWVGDKVGETKPTLTLDLGKVARVENVHYQSILDGKTLDAGFYREAGVITVGYLEYSLTGEDNSWTRLPITSVNEPFSTTQTNVNSPVPSPVPNPSVTISSVAGGPGFHKGANNRLVAINFDPVSARYIRLTPTESWVSETNRREAGTLFTASTFIANAKTLLIDERKVEPLTTAEIHYLDDPTRYVDEEEQLQAAVPGERVTVTTFNTENGVKTTPVGEPVVTVTNPQKAVYRRGTKLRPVATATYVQGEREVTITLGDKARAGDTVAITGIDGVTATTTTPGATLTLTVPDPAALSTEKTVVVSKDGAVSSDPVSLTKIEAKDKYSPAATTAGLTVEQNSTVDEPAIRGAITGLPAGATLTFNPVNTGTPGPISVPVTVNYADGSSEEQPITVPVTVTPVAVPATGYPDATVGIRRITASSGENVENLLDKNETTTWTSAPTSADGEQYIQVELEEEAIIRSLTYVPDKEKVGLLHPYYLIRAKLAYSSDGVTWTPLAPKGTTADSKGYLYDINADGIALGANTTTKNIFFEPVRAKFIRLIGTDSWVAPERPSAQPGFVGDTFSASEISVEAIKTIDVLPADIVRMDPNLTAASSEATDNGRLRPKENATDGDATGGENYWVSERTATSFAANADLRPHFTVGLTEDAYVNHLKYTPRTVLGHANGNLRKGYIEYRRSDEPEGTWHRVTDEAGRDKIFDVPATTNTHTLQFKPVVGQVFRLVATETYGYMARTDFENRFFAATEISVIGRKIEKETEPITAGETPENSANYYVGERVTDSSVTAQDGSRYTGKAYLTVDGVKPAADAVLVTDQLPRTTATEATASKILVGTYEPTKATLTVKRDTPVTEQAIKDQLSNLLPNTELSVTVPTDLTASAGNKTVNVTLTHNGLVVPTPVAVTVVVEDTKAHINNPVAKDAGLTVVKGTEVTETLLKSAIDGLPADGVTLEFSPVDTTEATTTPLPVSVTVKYDDQSQELPLTVKVTVTEPIVERDADYSAVDKAIARKPADLSIYTDTTANELTSAIDAVVRGKKSNEQDIVTGYATRINRAVDALVKKDADYSDVDAAIRRKPADLSIYTDDTARELNSAIDAVVRGKKIDEQAAVTAYATSINAAVDALVKKDADYSAVDEAIQSKPQDTSIYTEASVRDVETAITAVVRNKKADEQAIVDGYATAITTAIRNLVLKASERFSPTPTTLIRLVGEDLTENDIKEAVVVPNTAGNVTKELIGALPLTTTPGEQTASVKVVYSDDSFDTVEVTVQVVDESNREDLLALIRRQKEELDRIRRERDRIDEENARIEEEKRRAELDKDVADRARTEAERERDRAILAAELARDKAESDVSIANQQLEEARRQAEVAKREAEKATQAKETAESDAAAARLAKAEAENKLLIAQTDKQLAQSDLARAKAAEQEAARQLAEAEKARKVAEDNLAQANRDNADELAAAQRAKETAEDAARIAREQLATATAAKKQADDAVVEATRQVNTLTGQVTTLTAKVTAAETLAQAAETAKAAAEAATTTAATNLTAAIRAKETAEREKADAVAAANREKADAIAAANREKEAAEAARLAAETKLAEALAAKVAAETEKAAAIAAAEAEKAAAIAAANRDKAAAETAKAVAEAKAAAAEQAKANAQAEVSRAEAAKAEAETKLVLAEVAKAEAEQAKADALALASIDKAASEAARLIAEARAAEAERARNTAFNELAQAHSAKTAAESRLALAEAAQARAEREKVEALANAERTKADAIAAANREKVAAEAAKRDAENRALLAEQIVSAAQAALAQAQSARASAEARLVTAEIARAEAEQAKAEALTLASTDKAAAEAAKLIAEARATEAERAKLAAQAELAAAEAAQTAAATRLASAEAAKLTAEREKTQALAAAERAQAAAEAAQAEAGRLKAELEAKLAEALAVANHEKEQARIAAETAAREAAAAVKEKEKALAEKEEALKAAAQRLAEAEAARKEAEAKLAEQAQPVATEQPGDSSTTPIAPSPARTLRDSATGVTVSLAAGEDSRIIGLRILHKETNDVATPSVLAGKDYDLFDIELVDQNGQIVKTRYATEVILPVDNGKEVAEVIYLPNSDLATVLPFRTTVLENGQTAVVFTAPHFSEYGIVYKPAASVVTTGEASQGNPTPVSTVTGKGNSTFVPTVTGEATSTPVSTGIGQSTSTPISTVTGEETAKPATNEAASQVDKPADDSVVVARLTPKAPAAAAPVAASPAVAAPSAAAPAASAPAQASLPETGDEDSMAFSLGMAGLMSALGLMGVKSRKED